MTLCVAHGCSPQPRRGIALLLLGTALFLASAGRAIIAAQAANAPGRTVWDGVYTDAQAERATAVFGAELRRLPHADTGRQPPASGDKFWQSNTQKTVGDLLTYVEEHAERQRRLACRPRATTTSWR